MKFGMETVARPWEFISFHSDSDKGIQKDEVASKSLNTKLQYLFILLFKSDYSLECFQPSPFPIVI